MQRSTTQLLSTRLCMIALSIALTTCAVAQEPEYDDEQPEFLPGLIATIESGDKSITRVDSDIAFDWSTQAVDHRIAPKSSFKAKWSGYLQYKDSGAMRIHAHGAGKLRVRLADKEVLTAESTTATWSHSDSIELPFGRHAIEIEYQSSDDGRGKLALYWSGPQFEVEPIAERYFSHDFAQSLSEKGADPLRRGPKTNEIDSPPKGQTPFRIGSQSVNDPFMMGMRLSRALQCTSCHAGGDVRDSLPGPSLTHLNDNLHPEWLVDKLVALPEGAQSKSVSRMPHFGLSRADAEAIALTLFAYSAKSQLPVEYMAPKAKTKGERTQPTREAGRIAFMSLGCLACHQLDPRNPVVGEVTSPSATDNATSTTTSLGAGNLWGGGNLTNIAAKRPDNFFARWLDKPAEVNTEHRMPVYQLSALERADLVLYLQSLKQPQVNSAPTFGNQTDEKSYALGRRLLETHRCGACHKLPDALQSNVVRTRIGEQSNWSHGCLTAPDASLNRPGFGLDDSARASLRIFWTTVNSRAVNVTDGKELLVEHNCIACHVRDEALGLKETLANLATSKAADDQPLIAKLAALAPPALTGVGDKLHEKNLKRVLAGQDKPRRPWLDVRMPKYRLKDDESAAIVKHFVEHDRIPELDDKTRQMPDVPRSKEVELAAARLVTADGFGCQSCHQIGSAAPPKVAINAHGTDLTMLGERIRPSWFHRWVHNPARIVPRMEMPAIQVAVKGVLNDDLDLQLAALWQTLNTEGFEPPKPNPVRTVRNSNLATVVEHANVLTDVLETPKKNYLRPMLVGLSNRHNVLFDFESGAIASWWIGDTARQYTRGKSWFWEPGAQPLVPQSEFLQRFYLLDTTSQAWRPATKEQFVIQFDGLQHIERGIEWGGRVELQFESQSRWLPIVVRVESRDASSLAITASVKGLAAGEKIVVELPSVVTGTLRDDYVKAVYNEYAEVSLTSVGSIEALSPTQFAIVADATAATSDKVADLSWTTQLTTKLPADQFQTVSITSAEIPTKAIDCVPGFAGLQLPLPRHEMPTALDWSAAGELYLASLKGRVLRARDTNGDGLEDAFETISDDLPAPYGLAVNEDSVDVLCKTSLIRLQRGAQAAAPYRQQVIADGWGYTADYHDWAVGLPRDGSGGYYMALPCQQDDRSEAAAKLRGTALRLVPYQSAESPRAFRIETVAAGLRFPMGLALSRNGDLFATDNQGNYNPFNELNHIQFGRRYGFINKLENQPGFSPAFESPAVNVPHPWTRSVNGICFLESSSKDRDAELFGPFAGDLIGCEYNGLSLIRMSVQKVGDQIQGAAYLFSRPVGTDESTFEGPICCAVAPSGDIYVGNIHDSGWGGGQNTGSVVRLRKTGEVPLGLDEVRATATGFEIEFTQPVDRAKAVDPASYSIRSYRRISTPAYGGDDQDERTEIVREIQLSLDGKLVQLQTPGLRAGYVYEFNVAAIGVDGSAVFPNQAHYNMRAVPGQ